MVTYPITVARSGYRGADPKKRRKAQEQNMIATRLQEHINKQLLEQTSAVQVYCYHEIATDTGISINTVRELCFSIDGGSNGFTAIKHGMTYEQAMEENKLG